MTPEEELYQELKSRLPQAMETKMKKGRERWGDEWVDGEAWYMYDRTEEERMEWRQEVFHYNRMYEALKELADFNNYAIMCMALQFSEDAN